MARTASIPAIQDGNKFFQTDKNNWISLNSIARVIFHSPDFELFLVDGRSIRVPAPRWEEFKDILDGATVNTVE